VYVEDRGEKWEGQPSTAAKRIKVTLKSMLKEEPDVYEQLVGKAVHRKKRWIRGLLQ
jgi:hypothetical protein